MNSLILSLAPLSGLASALPAMATAGDRRTLTRAPGARDELRAFADVAADLKDDVAIRDHDGGHLFL